MNLKNLISDYPKKDGLNDSDLMDVVNFALCKIVETSIQDTVEVGDWVIHKIDETTLYLSPRYTSSDMSRFLHDEFSKKRLIKNVDKL